jgi:DNA (cytosine-5)-methyltransferase 1
MSNLKTDVAHSLRGEGFDASEDGTGRGTPLVPVAWTGDGVTADPISASEGKTYTHEGTSFRLHNCVQQPVAFSAKDYGADAGEVAPTLRAMGHANSHANGGGQMAVAQPVAFEPGSIARNAGPAGESSLAPTLRSDMRDNQPAVRIAMQVRRLTPVECERLQGFPDNYTNIPWRKKPEAPDGPRYKALGNSMAVPCMAWIGRRIDEVETLARGGGA